MLIAVVSISVLSFRPGGLRKQLRYAARRFRLALILGGAYVLTSAVVRFAFAGTGITDWALPSLAVGLAILFLVLGQNPREETL